MKGTTKYVALDVHKAMTVASVREGGGRIIAGLLLGVGYCVDKSRHVPACFAGKGGRGCVLPLIHTVSCRDLMPFGPARLSW